MGARKGGIAEKLESRQQKHRKKRRAAGLCGREGCPLESKEHYYCEDHRRDNLYYKKGVNRAEAA